MGTPPNQQKQFLLKMRNIFSGEMLAFKLLLGGTHYLSDGIGFQFVHFVTRFV
jgi:hypothetical protein